MSTPDSITMKNRLRIVNIADIKEEELELYGIPNWCKDNRYYIGALADSGKYIIYYKAPRFAMSRFGTFSNCWVSTYFLENRSLFGIPIVEVEL